MSTYLIIIAILGVIRPAMARPSMPMRFPFGLKHEPANGFPTGNISEYGIFPRKDDPFHFIPCSTSQDREQIPDISLSPKEAAMAWEAQFNPDPRHWDWAPIIMPGELALLQPHAIHLCGYLDVPLDYTNVTDKRIVRLAIEKIQVSGLINDSQASVSSTASQRTIIYNPGGPGGPGTDAVDSRGAQMSLLLSNGTLDVLGFDPRGVGRSQPTTTSCFAHDALIDRWASLVVQSRAEFESPLDQMNQLEIMDAMNEAIAKRCLEENGDLGRFMSTAFVARDMDAIRAAIGDSELNAYLVSYGTAIGQTYAGMFPDKVGRMVLDSNTNINANRERGGFSTATLANVTATYRDGFLGECIKAGPDGCALAGSQDGRKETLETLEQRMQSLFEKTLDRPLPVTGPLGPSLITHSMLMSLLGYMLRFPDDWPAMARALSELEQGDTELVAEGMEHMWDSDPAFPNAPDDARQSVYHMVVCGDASTPNEHDDSLQWYNDLWAKMTEQSPITGDMWFAAVFACRQFNRVWPGVAELYQGDLKHALSNRMLLISQTHDPVTPLPNALNVMNELTQKNANLIVQHGYGHGFRTDMSQCTLYWLQQYMMYGILPPFYIFQCYANSQPYSWSRSGAFPREAWARAQ